MRRIACLLLLLLACFESLAAQANDVRLYKLRALLVRMRADKVRERQATPDLVAAKHELRDWVESRLPGLHWYEDPKRLELQLNDELKKAKLVCSYSSWPNDNPCPDWTARGFVGEIKLAFQHDNRAVLVLQTAVGIEGCGFDESAYAYQWTTDHWQRFWQGEQNGEGTTPYRPQALQAVLVSPTGPGRHDQLVLTLGTEPWCTSSWRHVYIQAWEIKAGTPAPKLLVDEAENAYLGSDPPIQGSVGPSDILVEYSVGSIDRGVHNRREVRHYVFHHERVERVDPLVLSPRDFVDEWIQRPWSEMSRWTEPGALLALEKRHETQRATDGVYSGEFVFPTRHCTQKADLWQVEIELRSGSGKEEQPQYFLVRWRPPYRFTMVDASDQPWQDCVEEDRRADEFRTLFPGDWY